MPVAPSVIWGCFPFWRGGTKSGLCAGFRKGIIQAKLTSVLKEGVGVGICPKNPGLVSVVSMGKIELETAKITHYPYGLRANILTAARINIPPIRMGIRYGRHAFYRLKERKQKGLKCWGECMIESNLLFSFYILTLGKCQIVR